MFQEQVHVLHAPLGSFQHEARLHAASVQLEHTQIKETLPALPAPLERMLRPQERHVYLVPMDILV